MIAATIREGTVTQAARALQVLQHVPLTGRVVHCGGNAAQGRERSALPCESRLARGARIQRRHRTIGRALNSANTITNTAPDWSEGLFRALRLAAPRPGCRAVVAFSGGSPLGSLDVDRLVQQAVESEIAVHVVIFEMGPEIAPEWPRIASATQGSYRVLGDEDELQHAFWCVFSQLYSSYAITVNGVAGGAAQFRLAVRSPCGYGETSFEPLQTAEALPATNRRVK